MPLDLLIDAERHDFLLDAERQPFDLLDIDAARAYGQQLVTRYQHAGGLRFDGHRPTALERAIADRIRTYADLLALHIPTAPSSHLPILLPMHDMLHRLAYGVPPVHRGQR